MKVGIGSYAYRWAIGTRDAREPRSLAALDLLDKAAALGAQVVQICDNLPLDAFSCSELDALAARAAALHLDLEVGIRGSRPDHLRRSIAVARRIGARLLRVVLADGEWCPTLDEAAAIIRSVLPELHAAGVTLAIENHFDLPPAGPAHLVKAIDDPLVGVCLDPLNSIAKLVGPAETVAVLARLASSIHAKDAVITRHGTGFYIAGCPLGEGLVDLTGMLDAVRAAGRSPNVLVEGWMDQLEDEAATLAQEEAWARDGVAYLRRLL
jgi:sugar phosphate isomerase/epimerase